MQIQTQETEHQSAGRYAWVAARDASQRSAVYATTHGYQDKLKAERIKLMLDMMYYTDSTSITYCKNWIRVKAHNARKQNRELIAEMESHWAEQGITKKITAQGIIYNVRKVTVSA